jgi:hypothetical protein
MLISYDFLDERDSRAYFWKAAMVLHLASRTRFRRAFLVAD